MPPAHCSATGADWHTAAFQLLILRAAHSRCQKFIRTTTITFVYNGEIYNTDDLRHKLTTLGVHFKTTSDTEVLLLGFIHFGPSFIQDVDGIFALAVYDERHETLTIFRDCFGVKPLFTHRPETLSFLLPN